MIDPIRQACYELLKWMEEAWKMGGYWKMSAGSERGSAAAVSNLLIEMGLALITEARAAQSAPGDSRQILGLILVTTMNIMSRGKAWV